MLVKMTRFILLILFSLQFTIINVKCGKQFRLGRSKGGNLGLPAGVEDYKLPPAQWFTQKLDHFRPTDKRTWKQRYFVNESFYDFNGAGPVFLMIGGEGTASAKWMVKGMWINYAQTFKALCIQLEHRYYGESHPTEDLSTKNLQYLSSNQALADLAYFINSMNNKYKFKKEVKWIAFGGSYPGSLAAWLRLKYPHLVHASVSSSGPLLAKVNFMEYFQVVVDALREKTSSEECVTELKMAHRQIETMMKTDPTTIEKEFKVCTPFSNATKNDMKNFYNSIADDFADVVQYNEDNRMSADMQYRNVTINTVCDMLTKSNGEPSYKKLAAFNSVILKKSNLTCMDYSYNNMINELRNDKWTTEGSRQWMYQTCTEFGFYQTSSGEVEVFGNHFSLDFFVQQCQDVFGPNGDDLTLLLWGWVRALLWDATCVGTLAHLFTVTMIKAERAAFNKRRRFTESFVDGVADWTNNAYGALTIPASRVVYVHGSIDPWHALGMTTTENYNAPAILIHGTAHCANMYPPSPDDSAELIEARFEIQQFLNTWLSLP